MRTCTLKKPDAGSKAGSREPSTHNNMEETMNKTRLTHTNGHYKFWEVEVSGSCVHCFWGRIGTKSQSKTFNFSSYNEAFSYASKKVNQKLAKGYV